MSLKSASCLLSMSTLALLTACGGGGGGSANNSPGGQNPPVTNSPTNSPPSAPQPGQLQFLTATQSVGEADGTVTLTIARSGGSDGAIGVAVSTGGGTAAADSDYAALTSTVNFADGDATSKTVALTITNDSVSEADETITVTLANATGGATVGSTGTTTVTITDDDPITAAPQPTAATLAIGYDTKQLTFTWSGSSGATSYRFLGKEPAGTFEPLTADLPPTTSTFAREVPVHLYNWVFAATQYRVDACNAAGCTPSNVVTADATGSVLATGYLKASNSAADAKFGTAVATSADGKTFVVGAPDTSGNVGSVYIYSVPAGGSKPMTQPVRIDAPAAQPMRFGFTVALSRDGNTLAVGAPDDGNDAIGVGTYPSTPNNLRARSGAVFIYTRVNGAWSTTPAFLKTLDADAEDAFGTAVALSPDGNFLVAGAPGQDSPDNALSTANSAVDSGAAYAYTLVNGQWQSSQVPFAFKASNIGNGDRFGSSVAVSEDGWVIIVGAPFEDGAGQGIDPVDSDTKADSGAMYRFGRSSLSNRSWLEGTRYKASNSGASDNYGAAVAVSADGLVFAAGAPREDGNQANTPNDLGSNTGAVYVYTVPEAFLHVTPTPAAVDGAYLKAKFITDEALFGAAVALSADGNALAIGATDDPINAIGVDLRDQTQSAANSGAVDVKLRQANAPWSRQLLERTYVKASNTEADDLFGTAVSLSSDGSTLLVGAPGEDGSGVNFDANNNVSDNSFGAAGAAYLY